MSRRHARAHPGRFPDNSLAAIRNRPPKPAMKSSENAPRILMIAYACNPRGTGEHWLGWGWAEQAARSFQVDLITTTNHELEVSDRARECGINAHFVGLP